jgi:hypothetical protein
MCGSLAESPQRREEERDLPQDDLTVLVEIVIGLSEGIGAFCGRHKFFVNRQGLGMIAFG